MLLSNVPCLGRIKMPKVSLLSKELKKRDQLKLGMQPSHKNTFVCLFLPCRSHYCMWKLNYLYSDQFPPNQTLTLILFLVPKSQRKPNAPQLSTLRKVKFHFGAPDSARCMLFALNFMLVQPGRNADNYAQCRMHLGGTSHIFQGAFRVNDSKTNCTE